MSDVTVPAPQLEVFEAGQLMTTQEALVHAFVGAQYGDLEFDVGKSVRWTQWFTDDVFITDVNLGTPRYWIVNWTETFPEAHHTVTGVNWFVVPQDFRKKQFEDAQKCQGILLEPEDWVIFVDAHEGLCIDTRPPLPTDVNIEPFRSYLYREISRANGLGKDRLVIPFYAFLRHDNVIVVDYDSPAYADGSLGYTTAQGSLGTPYYIPNQGLTRMMKVSVLQNPAFNWATIDTPSTADTGMNLSIVSYGYAHWNIQDIVPPATTVEPLSEVNDDGWRMRKLISMVRPAPALPYTDPYKTPAQDPVGLAGPWAPADPVTPDPVKDSGLALVPLVGTVTTPDPGPLPNDCTLVYKVRGPTGGGAGDQALAAQYEADPQRSWFMARQTSGTLRFSSSPSGTPTGLTVLPLTGTAPSQVDEYGAVAIQLNSGGQRVLTRWSSTNGQAWTSANSATAASTAIFDSNSVLRIGANLVGTGAVFNGRIYSVELRTGFGPLGGATVNFSDVAGQYIGVPSAANLDITGDLEIVARCTTSKLNDPAQRAIVTKAGLTGSRAWQLSYFNSRIRFNFATAAVPGTWAQFQPTLAWPIDTMRWIKVTRVASTGVVSMWWAADQATEPSSWTAFAGSPTTLATGALLNTAAPLELGARLLGTNDLGAGRISRVIIRSTIGGAPVFDYDEALTSVGATTFPASTGQTLTANGAILTPVAPTTLWKFDANEYPADASMSYVDPRGRTWTLSAAGAIIANKTDPLPQPVTPDPSLAGLLVGLYDNVLRLNMRDGVYYEGDENGTGLGNIPLKWDANKNTWVPSSITAPEWHDTEEWVAPVA